MEHHRVKTLTMWLTFITLLATSAHPRRDESPWSSVSIKPTCKVKGEPQVEMLLHCGDGQQEGVVQYWHTPFGHLQASGAGSMMEPVLMNHDGALVIPNTSLHHSGSYYCMLQHPEGSSLWLYELSIIQNNQNDGGHEGSGRFRRTRRSVQEETPISEQVFAGAVLASVLLTFVVGFTAGALSRHPLLRCLRAITVRLHQSKQQHHQDSSSLVTVTSLPPTSGDPDTSRAPTPPSETRVSLTTPSPPAKPKRSFRDKTEQEPEAEAYLEQSISKEEVAGGGEDECDGTSKEEKENTEQSFYLLEDGESQSEADDRSSENRENDEGKRSEGKPEQEKASEEQNREGKDTESFTDTEEEESEKNEETLRSSTPDESSSSSPRRRVIRLYQYDEDGQRYSHLPEPAPQEPTPAPRLKQRSLSLTRLNTIMAAASAGPMEEGEGRSDEQQHFHMQI